MLSSWTLLSKRNNLKNKFAQTLQKAAVTFIGVKRAVIDSFVVHFYVLHLKDVIHVLKKHSCVFLAVLGSI